jgi:glycosyltransferase involved in cell wall biosynthesis
MTFSITIPAYKARFLDEAIKSVIAQTYQDWQLVIVDDCSPEDLKGIVEPYLADSRVEYYRNEKNCGAVDVVDNWNICLSHCTGDYVICMGDDDRLLPCCLEELSKTIDKYPELNVYHLQTEIIDESGKIIETLEERPEQEDVLSLMTKRWEGRKQYIGDFCYSRKHLNAFGGYYPLPYAWGSDDITLFRAALPSGIANVSRTGFQYRENQYSISLAHNDAEKVATVLLQREWYQKAFAELIPQGVFPKTDIQNALNSMNGFVRGLIIGHIKRDLKQGGVHKYWYWLWNYPKQVLSYLTMIKIYILSITQRP